MTSQIREFLQKGVDLQRPFTRFEEIQPFIDSIARRVFPENSRTRSRLEQLLGDQKFEDLKFDRSEATTLKINTGLYALGPDSTGCTEHSMPFLQAYDLFETIDALFEILDFYTEMLKNIDQMKPGFFDFMDQHIPSPRYTHWKLLDARGRIPKSSAKNRFVLRATPMEMKRPDGTDKTPDDLCADANMLFRCPFEDIITSLECGLFLVNHSSNDNSFLRGKFVNHCVRMFSKVGADAEVVAILQGQFLSTRENADHAVIPDDPVWTEQEIRAMYRMFIPRCLNYPGADVPVYLHERPDLFLDVVLLRDDVKVAIGVPGFGSRNLMTQEDENNAWFGEKPTSIEQFLEFCEYNIQAFDTEKLRRFSVRHNAVWSMHKCCPLFAMALRESGFIDFARRVFADIQTQYARIRATNENRYLFTDASVLQGHLHREMANPVRMKKEKPSKQAFDYENKRVDKEETVLVNPSNQKNTILNPKVDQERFILQAESYFDWYQKQYKSVGV